VKRAGSGAFGSLINISSQGSIPSRPTKRMSEYDPAPLLADLRKENAEKTAAHQVKKAMHPYRDKEDLADIRENIETIRDDLASLNKTVGNLKLPKRSAIGQAIGYKIEIFNLGNFFFSTVAFVAVVSALCGVGFLAYKWATADHKIQYCQYDYRTTDAEDGVNVTGVREWAPDSLWGPFKNLDEAKVFGKENHCPE